MFDNRPRSLNNERYKQMQLVASHIPLCNCEMTVSILAKAAFPTMQCSTSHIHNAEARVRQAISDLGRTAGVVVHNEPIPKSRERSIWVNPSPINQVNLSRIVLPVVTFELDPANDGIPWLDPLAKPDAPKLLVDSPAVAVNT